MSKAVLISIQPQWCEMIAYGKKTLEVRKNRPKLETPFKCYIYCTKTENPISLCTQNSHDYTCGKAFRYSGGGEVIGEFICDEIERFSIDPKYDNIMLSRMSFFSCVPTPQLQDYASDYWLYGWRISDLRIYDTPRELDSFRRECVNDLRCESCAMYWNNNGTCGNDALHLHRPPQGWCYVEEDDHETD